MSNYYHKNIAKLTFRALAICVRSDEGLLKAGDIRCVILQ